MIFLCPFLHCKALRTAMYKGYINSIINIIIIIIIINCIPNNMEKYMAFMLGKHLVFWTVFNLCPVA